MTERSVATPLMSYQPVPNSEPVSAPPAYAQEEIPRTEGDNVPDDFKYSVDVASCELPVRQMFIRKVYSLLTLQIIATVLVGTIIRSNQTIKTWCLTNLWLFFVSMFGSFGFLIATYFKARSYPINLVLLSGFTLMEAYSLGLVCSMVETDVVLQAFFLTLVVFIGLTLFAFQTKYDFISWQGFASMGLWILIGMGFMFVFFPAQSSGMQMVYGGLGVAVFSVYIVIDTQKIMKTAHLEDEIISTIQLYLDVVNVFLYILQILNARRD